MNSLLSERRFRFQKVPVSSHHGQSWDVFELAAIYPVRIAIDKTPHSSSYRRSRKPFLISILDRVLVLYFFFLVFLLSPGSQFFTVAVGFGMEKDKTVRFSVHYRTLVAGMAPND